MCCLIVSPILAWHMMGVQVHSRTLKTQHAAVLCSNQKESAVAPDLPGKQMPCLQGIKLFKRSLERDHTVHGSNY